jgi:hypothetical protein
MTVVVTPIDTITLEVGAAQIECQVTAINLQYADPSAGEPTRTGCGDVVTIPADTVEVATLDLTVFDDRTLATGFAIWTRIHRGETADFTLVVNPTETTAYQYTGKLTVAGVPDKQDAFTKIETVDVSFSVTEISDPVAVTP